MDYLLISLIHNTVNSIQTFMISFTYNYSTEIFTN